MLGRGALDASAPHEPPSIASPRPPGPPRLRAHPPGTPHCPPSHHGPVCCISPTFIRIMTGFMMVDSGFVVDLRIYSAPNQLNSPNQSRSLLVRVQHVPLLHHSSRSSCSESRTLSIRRTASAAYPAGSRRA